MRKYAPLAFLILSFSCSKQTDFEYKVESEFEPYVKRFVTEAAVRGKNIVINNLIIKYDAAISMQFCANSNAISSQNDRQKIIFINPQKCWQNDAQLEAMIFHELGHCILGRQHDTTQMPKGDPKTIMYPANIEMYSPCVYNIGGSVCDKLYRRSYYIDELFDPSTPIPDWAK